MAIPSLSDFRSAFPEMKRESDTTVEKAIERAQYFHNDTSRGVLLVSAHLISLDQLLPTDSTPAADGGQGIVKRERIGEQEVEYETNSSGNPSDVWWASTPYGREFLQLQAHNPRQVFSVLVG